MLAERQDADGAGRDRQHIDRRARRCGGPYDPAQRQTARDEGNGRICLHRHRTDEALESIDAEYPAEQREHPNRRDENGGRGGRPPSQPIVGRSGFLPNDQIGFSGRQDGGWR